MTSRRLISEFADLDHDRADRTGVPEVIYAGGKSCEQVLGIAAELMQRSGSFLATRVESHTATALLARYCDAEHDELARAVARHPSSRASSARSGGEILIVTAGTADLPVAREALITLKFLGHDAAIIADVGVAGLARVLAVRERLVSAAAICVVAGMEGALASVIAGLVSTPVVAVPTSVGHGASFSGLAALLAMLSSCAPGISVVNIDGGFSGACALSRILGVKSAGWPPASSVTGQ